MGKNLKRTDRKWHEIGWPDPHTARFWVFAVICVILGVIAISILH